MPATTPSGFHALPVTILQLSLDTVLKSGQSFRWLSYPMNPSAGPDEPKYEHRFCLRDRVICLQQSSTALYYKTLFPVQTTLEQTASLESQTLPWIKDYFQLDVDLSQLYDQWATADPVFRRFRHRFPGVRILRQDPWENLISFICSSNNNISRITSMVNNLCAHYTPPLLSAGIPASSELQAYHPFPPPSALTGKEVPATLRSLGFGYRAGFIHRTAQILCDAHPAQDLTCEAGAVEPPERWLMTLREAETASAREELLKFVGVGRKVADCVLLMSLDKREVVPVDTHVHQIAVKHYGVRSTSKKTMTPKLYDEVNEKLAGIWGEYAGWAHTVLFTADLKSFSAHDLSAAALEASVPPESPKKRTRETADDGNGEQTTSSKRSKR